MTEKIISLLVALSFIFNGAEAQYKVPGDPVITIESGHNGAVGESVTLLCISIGGIPAAFMEWTRLDTGEIIDDTYLVSTLNGEYTTINRYTFTITAGDDGILFNCRVKNIFSEFKNATWQVQAYVAPGDPVITGTTNVTAGEIASWTCQSNGGKPEATLTFFLNDVNLDVYSTVTAQLDGNDAFLMTNVLVYRPTSADDGGTLRCDVTHTTLAKEKTVAVTLTVRFDPEFDVFPQSYQAVYGEATTLSCVVTSNPASTSVSWAFNGFAISLPDSRYQGGTLQTPSLTILDVQPGDLGSYTCSATNDEGTTTSTPITLDNTVYAPIVTVPSNNAGTVGDDIILSCDVNALPPATTITWSRVNGATVTPVDMSSSRYSGSTVAISSLTIFSLVKSDTGDYRCTATNSVGTRSSNNDLDLVINYEPEVVVFGDSVGTLDGSITLSCQIDARPLVTSVDWYTVTGATLTPVNLNSPPGHYSGSSSEIPSLIFNSLLKSDAGIYRCTGTNVIGKGTSNTDLILVVNYPPENLQVTSTSVTLDEGDNVTITCSADGLPTPTYQWKLDGSAFPSGSTLDINPVGPEHYGTFVCDASNSAGSSTVDVVMDVRFYPRPCVKACPPHDFDVQLNTPVTLDCATNSNPDPTSYIWSFKGVNLLETGKLLLVAPTDAAQYGDYTCVAINPLGQSDPITFTVNEATPSTRSDVTSTSEFSTIPTITSSNTGSSSDGESPSTVTVMSSTSSDTVTMTTSDNTMSTSDSTLTTSDNTTMTSDTTMTTSDTTMMTSDTTMMTSDNTPSTTSTAVPGSGFPKVTVPETAVGTLNKDISLSCNIDANPSVTAVEWSTVNGKIVTPIDVSAERYSGSTKEIPPLTIQSLRKSDAGVYHCAATNDLGTGESNPDLTLVVHYPPENIEVTSMTLTLIEGANATVTCSADGNPTPGYEWTFGGKIISSAAALSLISVGPEHYGTFTCTASNNAGSSTAVVMMDVRFFPRICMMSCPQTEFEAEINVSLTLECTTFSNPPPDDYVWTFNGEILTETGPSLEVTPLSSAQFGEYTCMAINIIGQSETLMFNVTEKELVSTSGILSSSTGTLSVTIDRHSPTGTLSVTIDPHSSAESMPTTTVDSRLLATVCEPFLLCNTWAIALIVMAIILLIGIIIMVVVCLYIHGKCPCCKPKNSRINPANERTNRSTQPFIENIRFPPTQQAVIPPYHPAFKPQNEKSNLNRNLDAEKGGVAISSIPIAAIKSPGSGGQETMPEPNIDPVEVNESEVKQHKKKRRRKKKKPKPADDTDGATINVEPISEGKGSDPNTDNVVV